MVVRSRGLPALETLFRERQIRSAKAWALIRWNAPLTVDSLQVGN